MSTDDVEEAIEGSGMDSDDNDISESGEELEVKPKKKKPAKKAAKHARKPKAPSAARSVRAKGKPGGLVKDKDGRVRLPRRVRMRQETFRVTDEERTELVEKAMKEGAISMSEFYRTKLGLAVRAL